MNNKYGERTHPEKCRAKSQDARCVLGKRTAAPYRLIVRPRSMNLRFWITISWVNSLPRLSSSSSLCSGTVGLCDDVRSRSIRTWPEPRFRKERGKKDSQIRSIHLTSGHPCSLVPRPLRKAPPSATGTRAQIPDVRILGPCRANSRTETGASGPASSTLRLFLEPLSSVRRLEPAAHRTSYWSVPAAYFAARSVRSALQRLYGNAQHAQIFLAFGSTLPPTYGEKRRYEVRRPFLRP